MVTTNTCIWCLGKEPNSSFTSVSHILPECVGNDRQQTLPKGVVCDKCNNFFGQKIEPALLQDPIFHVLAVALRFKHPGKNKLFRQRIFDEQHPAIGGEHQTIKLNATVSNKNLTLDIDYRTKGRMSRSYEIRDLAFISRAVHKIAFESLADEILVKGQLKEVDIFDSRFEHIRQWAREGNPQNYVRPVLRLQTLEKVNEKWGYRIWGRGDTLVCELNLFGDWYGVSLTSSPDQTASELKSRIGPEKRESTWCITDRLLAINSVT